jgi:hypothetical protein
MHRSKESLYSITSSAVASTPDGIVRPNRFGGVLGLISISNPEIELCEIGFSQLGLQKFRAAK